MNNTSLRSSCVAGLAYCFVAYLFPKPIELENWTAQHCMFSKMMAHDAIELWLIGERDGPGGEKREREERGECIEE